MADIFGLFLDLILKLWEGIGAIYEPFMAFIQMAADQVLPVLVDIATFLIEGITSIINGIKAIISFFSPGEDIGHFGGGGFGGGGGGFIP